MTGKQRIVLLAGLCFVLCLGLVPPWRSVGAGMNGELVIPVNESAGHAFLFSGPSQSTEEKGALRLRPQIDGGLLLAEIIIIMAISGLVICGIASARK